MKRQLSGLNLLVAVMVELVVRAQGRQSPHPHAVGEKDLGCSINPSRALQQLLPLRGDVVDQAVNRSFQCESPTEKDDHDEVGEEGGEPDDLPRAVQTFGDDAVDTEPG